MKCQYDLAGLDASAQCPECGTDNLEVARRRAEFVEWNNPRDAALVILFVLNFCLGAFVLPKFSLLAFVLLVVIVLFESATVPEGLFRFARAVKVTVICCGSASLLFLFVVLML